MIVQVPIDGGTVYLQIAGERLRRVWVDPPAVPDGFRRAVTPERAGGWVRELAGDLQAYMAGRRVDLARWEAYLDLGEATPFRRRVYRELLRVGRGDVCTYGELAARAGSPRAARAVGGAMSHNPLPLVVPCHRVLAHDGLGGYGGRPELKRRLLALEGALHG